MRHVSAALTLFLIGCGDGFVSPYSVFRATSVSAGPDHACAISAVDGAAYCWGNNTLTAFGQAIPDYSFSPVKVPTPAGLAFIQVSTGYGHACALTEARDAICWGWGAFGQNGAGESISGGPLLVVGGHSFSALSAGWYHTCALDTSGAAWCWGRDSQGQLGDGSNTVSFAPVAVAGGLHFRSISAGTNHTCAVTLAGAGYCWGANDRGQLGNGGTVDSPVPTPVAGGLVFTSISAGYSHSCGTTGSGGYCWGSGDAGELGNNGMEPAGLPGAVAPSALIGGLAFRDVEAGYRHSCGLVGGQAYCWGDGTWGQLGTGLMQYQANPVSVAGPSGVNGPDLLDLASISPGGITYSCGLTSAGGVFCWGRGDRGQLGRQDVTLSTLPARVGGGH